MSTGWLSLFLGGVLFAITGAVLLFTPISYVAYPANRSGSPMPVVSGEGIGAIGFCLVLIAVLLFAVSWRIFWKR